MLQQLAEAAEWFIRSDVLRCSHEMWPCVRLRSSVVSPTVNENGALSRYLAFSEMAGANVWNELQPMTSGYRHKGKVGFRLACGRSRGHLYKMQIPSNITSHHTHSPCSSLIPRLHTRALRPALQLSFFSTSSNQNPPCHTCCTSHAAPLAG